MVDEQLDPEVVKVNLERMDRLYLAGGINPQRWERVRKEIHIEDVIADLTGHSISASGKIRCPFHGTDSDPSFWVHQGFGWCFGCPVKQQYYDQIRFVSRYLDISRVAALRWLETKWELPHLPELPCEEENEEYTAINLHFEDLIEPYIQKSIRQVQEFKDVELAEDYLHYFFKATQQMKLAEDAKKEGEIEDATEFEVNATTILARVLGKEELHRIFSRKQIRKGK